IGGFLLIEDGAIVNIHPNATILIEGPTTTNRIVYVGDVANLFYPYILENTVITTNKTINYNT
ncbi:hypothetical protein LJC11_00890, partial [Bacteroidales bacterium OttesenSCG-928-I21]|nr:hypothetical protein [Bacteroidales bacterium OttesenSCG-928-I21]